MASITENRNKENRLVSFTIRVSLGVDYNGKKILKNTTFKCPLDLTEKQARKAAELYAADFEKKCRQSGAADINVKFGDYCKTYLSTANHTLEKSTYEFYERNALDTAALKPLKCALFVFCKRLQKGTATGDGYVCGLVDPNLRAVTGRKKGVLN